MWAAVSEGAYQNWPVVGCAATLPVVMPGDVPQPRIAQKRIETPPVALYWVGTASANSCPVINPTDIESMTDTLNPRGRRIGYGRVSTATQTEEAQRASLQAARCDEVYTETISSGKKDRPVLAKVMSQLQSGDTLVVVKLDRWARSLRELLTMAAELDERGIALHVLDQQIETSTPTGKLMFSVLGAVAEFERELGIQRSRDSVEHRRATGGDLGGRRKTYTPEQATLVGELRAAGDSFRTITRKVNLSLGTVQRILT